LTSSIHFRCQRRIEVAALFLHPTIIDGSGPSPRHIARLRSPRDVAASRAPPYPPAISTNLHSAFANVICRGVLHATCANAGLATMTANAIARDTATFRRLRL